MNQDERRKSKSSMVAINLSGSSGMKSLGKLNRDKTMSRIMSRKHSFGFRRISGIRPTEITSMAGVENKRPLQIYSNTYQQNSFNPFNVFKVQKVTEEILDQYFTGHIYSVKDSPVLALRLASEIMREVKYMQYNRYRIICVVTLGQKRSQSYNNAISFIWDHERDNYYNTQREVTTAFIQVTVFGIYLD